eukprot:3055906-Rhodomonas_salina.1
MAKRSTSVHSRDQIPLTPNSTANRLQTSVKYLMLECTSVGKGEIRTNGPPTRGGPGFQGTEGCLAKHAIALLLLLD